MSGSPTPSASDSPISLRPIPASALPSTSSEPAYTALISNLLTNASKLTTSLRTDTPKWKWGKTYKPSYERPNHTKEEVEIRTASALHPPGAGADSEKWFARVSQHRKASYEGFVEGLLKNHSPNEAEYIESCMEAKLLATIADGELAQYRMSYHLPPPTTDREFVILILTKDISPPGGPRKLQVVTVPTEHPNAPPRKEFVRGKYASVEEVEELEGGGVEWRMATVSNPAGLVPQWITELAMPSKISEDVPSFLEWIEKKHVQPA